MELSKKKTKKQENKRKVYRRINLIPLHRISHLESKPAPLYFIYKNSEPEKLSDMSKIEKASFFIFQGRSLPNCKKKLKMKASRMFLKKINRKTNLRVNVNGLY